MGWTGEVNFLEELELLICDNVLPENDMPEIFYMANISPGARRLILYLSRIHRYVVAGR